MKPRMGVVWFCLGMLAGAVIEAGLIVALQ